MAGCAGKEGGRIEGGKHMMGWGGRRRDERERWRGGYRAESIFWVGVVDGGMSGEGGGEDRGRKAFDWLGRMNCRKHMLGWGGRWQELR